MCLVAIAWRAHPRYPLIIAGNRDEFHERPTASAGWWDESTQVFGGRDLQAGGSWLAVSRNGRFAAVVNNPRRPPGPTITASRGHLVRDFVAGDKPSGRFLDALQVVEARYAGFCLIAGTPVQVRGFVSPRGTHPGRWTLPAGVSVFSNSPLEAPWPKVHYLQAALSALFSADTLDTAQVFATLASREPVGAADAGHYLAGHTPFLVGERYGTRASTVVTIDSDGQCDFEERCFDQSGRPSRTVHERFTLAR